MGWVKKTIEVWVDGKGKANKGGGKASKKQSGDDDKPRKRKRKPRSGLPSI